MLQRVLSAPQGSVPQKFLACWLRPAIFSILLAGMGALLSAPMSTNAAGTLMLGIMVAQAVLHIAGTLALTQGLPEVAGLRVLVILGHAVLLVVTFAVVALFTLVMFNR